MENGEEAPKQEQKMDTTNDRLPRSVNSKLERKFLRAYCKIDEKGFNRDHTQLNIIVLPYPSLNFAIGPQKLPFQLGVDASWKPIVCYFFLFPFISQ